MIDLHAHILPGFDDGVQSWQEAVELARLAVRQGVSRLVAAPHVLADQESYRAALRLPEAVAQLQAELGRAEVPLEVIGGAEVRVDEAVPEQVQRNPALTIGGQGKYLLLELPPGPLPRVMEQVVFQLQLLGITPIIAHPERCWEWWEDPASLAAIIERGALAQVTAESLVGGAGPELRRAARRLLRAGLVQFLASDVHRNARRMLQLRPAVREAAKVLGEARAEALVEANPAAVLAGEPVGAELPEPEGRRGRGLVGRLRGWGRHSHNASVSPACGDSHGEL